MWIKLSDRKPTKKECYKDCGWFLVYHKPCFSGQLGRAQLSRYDGHDEIYSYDHGWKYAWDESISHWMPLPEIPKD